ncbi:MAG: Eco57I restriction-modification methylase domain-containing protein [Kiritimatiellae bacterium]|nr:Eco57I restriction-modification methylase domain-containing protein [Kiritimatiellia bacterium]
MILTNPPYVRHHHIDGEQKQWLKDQVLSQLKIQVSGLSGLYIYYILLSHNLLKEGGIATWLIPSEFLYTNYGKALREYLSRKVSLLRIHKFDAAEVQFDDALVSSCVVTYKKEPPVAGHKVDFTMGNFHAPILQKKMPFEAINPLKKWNFYNSDKDHNNDGILLSDIFHITRGIATGNNKFFILEPDDVRKANIEPDCLIPLIPGPRDLKSPVIEADARGQPIVEKVRYLLSVTCSLDEARDKYPNAFQYLIEPKELRSVRLDTPPSWLSIVKETQAEFFYQSTITL